MIPDDLLQRAAMANMLGGMPPKPDMQPKGMMALGSKQPLGAMTGPQLLPVGGGLPVMDPNMGQLKPLEGAMQPHELPNPNAMRPDLGQVQGGSPMIDPELERMMQMQMQQGLQMGGPVDSDPMF